MQREIIVILSLTSIRKRDSVDIGQRPVSIMNYFSVLSVGNTGNISIGDTINYIFNCLLTFTPYNNINSGASVKEMLNLLGSFISSDYNRYIVRHLTDKLANLFETEIPPDADT